LLCNCPVPLGGGVHVGSDIKHELYYFGEIARYYLAMCFNAVGTEVGQQRRVMAEFRSLVNEQWLAQKQPTQSIGIPFKYRIDD